MQTAQINRGLHIKSSCALHRELFLNITIMSRNLLHLPTSINSHQDTVSHILVVHHVTFIKFLKTGEISIGICESNYDKVFE